LIFDLKRKIGDSSPATEWRCGFLQAASAVKLIKGILGYKLMIFNLKMRSFGLQPQDDKERLNDKHLLNF
jgi:hypothetical protein